MSTTSTQSKKSRNKKDASALESITLRVSTNATAKVMVIKKELLREKTEQQLVLLGRRDCKNGGEKIRQGSSKTSATDCLCKESRQQWVEKRNKARKGLVERGRPSARKARRIPVAPMVKLYKKKRFSARRGSETDLHNVQRACSNRKRSGD